MKKFFILGSISVFIGLIYLVLHISHSFAMPPFEVPAAGGLPACQVNLADCEAQPVQIFPGDGAGDGPALSYMDNGDGTFTDDNTGFMWEIKTNVAGSVHNVNNTYWWSANIASNPDGTLFTMFLDTLNTTCDGAGVTNCASGCGAGVCGFAGYQDWRIPNVKELQSIVDYGTSSPAIDPSLPGLTATPNYWSATTAAFGPVNAYFVNFDNGQCQRRH